MLERNEFNFPSIDTRNETVFRCALCGEEIYKGEYYYSSDLGRICTECDRAYLFAIRRIASGEE